jgi:hypothetical protein
MFFGNPGSPRAGGDTRPAVISRSAPSESIFLCDYFVEAQTPCRSASIMAYRRKLRLFQALEPFPI